MNLMKAIGLLAVSLIPLYPNVAQADDPGKMVRIETARPSSFVPLFVQAKEGANTTVLLMPGGKGGIGALGKDGRPSSTNFVIRSGELFSAAGFNVAMMSKPSDLPELDGPARVGADHMDDIRKTVSYLKQRFGVPVWIVGTSWGSTSTAAAAIALRDENLIAGIVLTSSITAYRLKQAVPRLELEKINVPTLVMHHEQDACQHCRPFEVSSILQGLKAAPVKKQIMVNAGSNPTGDGPLFPLGQVVATPGALEHCAKNNISPMTLIERHHRGDWGDLCDDDRVANENALFAGGRLLSAYGGGGGEKLYCITEWDRSATTLLLAQEY